MPQKTFAVLHMTCAACATSVERFLHHQEGVQSASVNFANQRAIIDFSDDTSVDQLQLSVQSIGYDILPIETEQQKQALEQRNIDDYRQLKRRTIGALVFAIPLFIIGMFFMDMNYANGIMWGLATPLVFYFGRSFFVGAYNQLKMRSANMDTLVAMSTGLAYAFSVFNTFNADFWHHRGMHAHVYFEASGIVIAFILLGKLLEEKAKGSTNSAIKKLMGLQPKTATLITKDGRQIEQPIARIQKNDILLIRPGERIAVDGEVIQGNSYLDESSITGEPTPTFKQLGDTVLSGSINQKGSFQMFAKKVGAQTLLSQIIQQVEQAQASKAPIQKTVDKIASVFVPIVLILAIVSGVMWFVFGDQYGLERGIMATITVLVIACPCALGLATPTAIMVGVGKAAQQGILIKNAESIELARKIDTIILDKTGTITLGKPTVNQLEWTVGPTPNLQSILYTIERSSEHPLAEAICKYLQKNSVFLDNVAVENHEGQGIRGKYKDKEYIVGNVPLMEQNKITFSLQQRQTIDQLLQTGQTVVCFASQQQLLAILSISDAIKPTSQQAIHQLQQQGLNIMMLTGDNQQSAQNVANAVGIKDYRANVLPSQKAQVVAQLQQNGKVVAMVGDGINDSNALAQANVSIAMGKGSDIAMEIANMTIVPSDLTKIGQAITISKQTSKTIRQNLFWAFIYNMIGIPIAAGILYPINGFVLDPMWAGGAMALSSVSVVVNSLLSVKK